MHPLCVPFRTIPRPSARAPTRGTNTHHSRTDRRRPRPHRWNDHQTISHGTCRPGRQLTPNRRDNLLLRHDHPLDNSARTRQPAPLLTDYGENHHRRFRRRRTDRRHHRRPASRSNRLDRQTEVRSTRVTVSSPEADGNCRRTPPTGRSRAERQPGQLLNRQTPRGKMRPLLRSEAQHRTPDPAHG